MYEKIDDLRVDIGVGVKVVPATFVRGFSGSGVKRRREDVATAELAQRLAKHINWVHKFYEDGKRVEVEDLADFLFQHLTAMPDEVAKNLTSKNSYHREKAHTTIVSELVNALISNWQVKFEPATPSLPGQGLKWHAVRNRSE